MSSVKQLIEKADAIAKADLSEASLDLQSFVASYKSKVKAKDERGRAVWARAVVRRAAREGVEGKGSGGRAPTKAEIEAEIEERNRGRAEADLIVPGGTTKADLEKALADDDARQ